MSATSGVIAEVARRKALVAALPVHLLANKSAAEAIRCVLALHDHEAARALSVSQMQRIAAVLAPLQPWNELDVTPDAELHGRPAMSLPSCARVVVRSRPRAQPAERLDKAHSHRRVCLAGKP